MILRTNKNRKIEWRKEYSRHGKCLRCYLKGGEVVFINQYTGYSDPGQNQQSKKPNPKPATFLFPKDEYIPNIKELLNPPPGLKGKEML